jgi:hypothetical protein
VIGILLTAINSRLHRPQGVPVLATD